mmetsp:Transcript_55606/g.149940  ORF Transcript_55606/g.149940 Transcript_55606/m.149940 type:complete len:233 (-) Transcript_55606:58-756(-)
MACPRATPRTRSVPRSTLAARSRCTWRTPRSEGSSTRTVASMTPSPRRRRPGLRPRWTPSRPASPWAGARVERPTTAKGCPTTPGFRSTGAAPSCDASRWRWTSPRTCQGAAGLRPRAARARARSPSPWRASARCPRGPRPRSGRCCGAQGTSCTCAPRGARCSAGCGGGRCRRRAPCSPRGGRRGRPPRAPAGTPSTSSSPGTCCPSSPTCVPGGRRRSAERCSVLAYVLA